MDFVHSLTDMPRQDSIPMLQEPTSSHDPLFSPEVQTSQFYQPDRAEGGFVTFLCPFR